MQIIDSHCHLNLLDLSPYDGKIEGVLAEAKALGVSHCLCVSVNRASLEPLTQYAKAFDTVYISVGVHPCETEEEECTLEWLVSNAQDDKVIALGETGLDYFHIKDERQWQHERFERHVAAAQQTGLPLIVHTRDAKEDTLTHLKKASEQGVSGVLHCFTEDWDMAKRAIDMGFFVSFSGIVTFKNAVQIQEVAQKIPSDRYLVETDSPYLAPVPYRGKRNVPGYTRYVAEYIATLRNVSVEEVAEESTANFKRCFPRVVID